MNVKIIYNHYIQVFAGFLVTNPISLSIDSKSKVKANILYKLLISVKQEETLFSNTDLCVKPLQL